MNETKEHIEMEETEDSELSESNETNLTLEEQMVIRFVCDIEEFVIDLSGNGVNLSFGDLSEIMFKALAEIAGRGEIAEVLSKSLKDYYDKLPDKVEIKKETKEEPKGVR